MPRPNAGRRGGSNRGSNSFRGRKSSGKPYRKEGDSDRADSSSAKPRRSPRPFRKSAPGEQDSPRASGKRFSGPRSDSFKKEDSRRRYSGGRKDDQSSSRNEGGSSDAKRGYRGSKDNVGKEQSGKRYSGPPREKKSFRSRDESSRGDQSGQRFSGPSREKKPFRSRDESSRGDQSGTYSKGPFKGKSDFKQARKSGAQGKEKNDSDRGFSNRTSARPFRAKENNGDNKRSPRKDGLREREKHKFFNRERENSDKRTSNEQPSTAPVQTEKIRLNRFIANSGVCSRREADELISMGLIAVNGKTITELGYKVNPGDEVRYENKVLRAEKNVYILLNKPKGYLTTTDDPQERKTVMQLLGNSVKERIYPVGRLDRNTTGLLLLTNDGDLADKLMHPSYNVKKIYKVELDRPLARADFQTILDGVKLEEGRAMVDDLALVSDDGKTVGIELHIGWNRVVRRIFESLNYEVIRLDRSVYAGLDKKDLGRGEWRYLTKEEIVRLKHFK